MNITSSPQTPEAAVQTVPLRKLSGEALKTLSRDRLLSLSLEEMEAIRTYFNSLGRDPTDAELETLAQTWSEHCVHKTLKGIIEYRENAAGNGNGKTVAYDNLFKQTIMKVTTDLAPSWCLSTFTDNAGIIEFDEEFGVAFKVETHNHPSALEPYGGASTGLGGVIRDILGVGLGAKPILNTDIFCFGFLDTPKNKVPRGALSPRRILQGVVSGVRDYGNRMGIPTSNGAVLFHPGYLANPLVFCGTVGLIPRDKIAKTVSPGDLIVAAGGRTGRDGIHGATFSSAPLKEGITSSVVQIGHAIMEKKVMDVLLQARDRGLYRSVTDCGAGGFSSAVGEMAESVGARVDLEKAPLKYAGLTPWEIWLSESQERMVLAVPPENWETLRVLFAAENVEAAVLGRFTDDKTLRVFHKNQPVCELGMTFLHGGMPRQKLSAEWREPAPRPKEPAAKETKWGDVLVSILSHPNIASKEWIIRQYDHEVQGGSVIKPLMGKNFDGPMDACVVTPHLYSWKGVAVSNGINSLYGSLDPYWMAASAISEAIRNLVAVGANPDRIALLDNFCWGDPKNPLELGGLVRAAQACYDVAKAFGAPFISGKDSLNNTWHDPEAANGAGAAVSIPGTLLISGLGLVSDVRYCVTSDFKEPENPVYLIGRTRDELGGSYCLLVTRRAGGQVPQVEARYSKRVFKLLHTAIKQRFVRACHDLSEGGLAVAIAEMCFGGGLGADLTFSKLSFSVTEGLTDEMLLFSESQGRFLVEVKPEHKEAWEQLFFKDDIPCLLLGQTTTEPLLKVQGLRGENLIAEPVERLKTAWKNGFTGKL
jgi:phosphoribosylformylglycinamidine synthase II